jgi:serine/threonine protein kinase
MAGALDKAHRNGVIHGDLKPSNIILTRTGTKLVDFGLAKPVASLANLATLTVTKRESAVTEQGGDCRNSSIHVSGADRRQGDFLCFAALFPI